MGVDKKDGYATVYGFLFRHHPTYCMQPYISEQIPSFLSMPLI